MRTKKVSIIIPTYNQSQFIEKSIESALSQDYPNLEVVLSDDNSSDDIKKIASKYKKDKRFKYFLNKSNLGRVRNYHKSLYKYATGDYVLILDGDDYLIDNSFISKAMKFIEKGAIMVFAKQKVLLENKNKLIEDKINSDLPKLIDGNWLFLNYPKGYVIPHLAALYNRKYAIKIGFYKENIISSDWESILRLILNNKVGFINEFVGVWRKHSTNFSRNFDIIEIMNNVKHIENPYNFCLKNKLFDKKTIDKWRLKMLKRYFVKNLLMMLATKRHQEYKVLLNNIKDYDFATHSSIIRDVRFNIMLVAIKNKFITHIIFKYILKNESFMEDLV